MPTGIFADVIDLLQLFDSLLKYLDSIGRVRNSELKSTSRIAEAIARADSIVRHEFTEAGLNAQIWQAFAVLLPVRSVGVMGDQRTYEDTCVVRRGRST